MNQYLWWIDKWHKLVDNLNRQNTKKKQKKKQWNLFYVQHKWISKKKQISKQQHKPVHNPGKQGIE